MTQATCCFLIYSSVAVLLAYGRKHWHCTDLKPTIYVVPGLFHGTSLGDLLPQSVGVCFVQWKRRHITQNIMPLASSTQLSCKVFSFLCFYFILSTFFSFPFSPFCFSPSLWATFPERPRTKWPMWRSPQRRSGQSESENSWRSEHTSVHYFFIMHIISFFYSLHYVISFSKKKKKCNRLFQMKFALSIISKNKPTNKQKRPTERNQKQANKQKVPVYIQTFWHTLCLWGIYLVYPNVTWNMI